MRVSTLFAAALLVAAPLVPSAAMAQQTALNTIGNNARMCVKVSTGAMRMYSPKLAANGGSGPLTKPWHGRTRPALSAGHRSAGAEP